MTLSVLSEIVLSALFAPVMMLAQSLMVWDIFTGNDSGWKPQRRNDGSISFATALRTHAWHTFVGVGAAILTWYLHPGLFLWMLPVTLGLMLSALLSWVSGKRTPGKFLKFFGIFSTPEERRQPAILQAVITGLTKEKVQEENSPLGVLLTDADFRAWHCAQLVPSAVDHIAFDPEFILARAKAERTATAHVLEGWLTQRETMALLHNRELIEEVTLALASKSASNLLSTVLPVVN